MSRLKRRLFSFLTICEMAYILSLALLILDNIK